MRTMVGKRVVGLSIVSALLVMGRVHVVAVAALAGASVALAYFEIRALDRVNAQYEGPDEHDLAA